MLTSSLLLTAASENEFLSAFGNSLRQRWSTGLTEAFNDLVSWNDLNRLITIDRLQEAKCRLLLRGREIPLEMVSAYTSDGRRVLAPDLLQRHCSQGLSILLSGVHQDIPAVAALCAGMERRLSVPCGANLYASFGRESAFRPHADDHDVLVLQIAGQKQWQCFGKIADRPGIVDHLPPPVWEDVLSPGDVLYVPRGDVHQASVTQDASLHLTLSLRRPRISDLLTWFGRKAVTGSLSDRDLPDPTHNAPDGQPAGTALRPEELTALAADLTASAYRADQQQQREPFLPLNLGLITELKPQCFVQSTLRRMITLPETGPETGPTVVRIGGRDITFSAAECAVMAVLLRTDGCSLVELGELCGLPEAEMREAVRSLAIRSLVLLG